MKLRLLIQCIPDKPQQLVASLERSVCCVPAVCIFADSGVW